MSDRPPRCSKCGSQKVESNHFDTHSVSHLSIHQYFGRHSNPVVLGITAGLWAVGAAANAFREDWVCSTCGHEFTPEPPPEKEDESDRSFFDFLD